MNGKGQGPRKGYNYKKFADNYDEIFRKPQVPKCQCGCGEDAVYLISGSDFDGKVFKDEPACHNSAIYCEESAHELGRPFEKKRIET